MLGITFIESGSKGNSALLELDGFYYLLDAGISCKKICDYLTTRNLTLKDLKGIFITHEHDDHIKGIKVLLNKAPHLKIYCTKGTASAIVDKGIPINHFEEMDYESPVEIDGCSCTAFKVSHDAVQPMGLHIENSNSNMVMATDLGYVTQEVLAHTKNADLLCIESNYDADMLKASDYPGWLKQRIKSRDGHLPNEGVRGILSRMEKVPQGLVLMHISQDTNTEERALAALEPFFDLDSRGARFRSVHVSVASQFHPSERLTVGERCIPENLKRKLMNSSENISLSTKNQKVAGL